jgi:hypothetical protein
VWGENIDSSIYKMQENNNLQYTAIKKIHSPLIPIIKGYNNIEIKLQLPPKPITF